MIQTKDFPHDMFLPFHTLCCTSYYFRMTFLRNFEALVISGPTHGSEFKGICKVSHKVVPLLKGFITLLCNCLCDLGIFFDDISFSLDCCVTRLWHPINTNYVFKHSRFPTLYHYICRTRCFPAESRLNVTPTRDYF